MDDNASLQNPKTSDAVMKDTLVESALGSAKRAIELGMGKDKIVFLQKCRSYQIYWRFIKTSMPCRIFLCMLV